LPKSSDIGAEIDAGMEGGAMGWTLHWTELDEWLGYNVEVKVDAE